MLIVLNCYVNCIKFLQYELDTRELVRTGWVGHGTMTHSNSSYLLQVSGITTPMKTSNLLNAQLVHDECDASHLESLYSYRGRRIRLDPCLGIGIACVNNH